MDFRRSNDKRYIFDISKFYKRTTRTTIAPYRIRRASVLSSRKKKKLYWNNLLVTCYPYEFGCPAVLLLSYTSHRNVSICVGDIKITVFRGVRFPYMIFVKRLVLRERLEIVNQLRVTADIEFSMYSSNFLVAKRRHSNDRIVHPHVVEETI